MQHLVHVMTLQIRATVEFIGWSPFARPTDEKLDHHLDIGWLSIIWHILSKYISAHLKKKMTSSVRLKGLTSKHIHAQTLELVK